MKGSSYTLQPKIWFSPPVCILANTKSRCIVLFRPIRDYISFAPKTLAIRSCYRKAKSSPTWRRWWAFTICNQRLLVSTSKFHPSYSSAESQLRPPRDHQEQSSTWLVHRPAHSSRTKSLAKLDLRVAQCVGNVQNSRSTVFRSIPLEVYNACCELQTKHTIPFQ